MTDEHDLRQERLAQNQALYRTVNEEVQNLNARFSAAGRSDCDWICECADLACTRSVSALVSEYEAIRSNPRTFIVYPGHVFPEVERVVAVNERYAVVEKFGVGGLVADATDPRRVQQT